MTPDLTDTLRTALGPAWAVAPTPDDSAAVAYGPGRARLWVDGWGLWEIRQSDGGESPSRWPVVAAGDGHGWRDVVGGEMLLRVAEVGR
jgi:hypothetical protein